MSVSLVVVVRNEEANISKMLDSCLNAGSCVFDEIVIVDQQSVDRTREIALAWARDNGVGIKYEIDERVGYCELSRQKAITLAAFEWVFWLDADEELSQKLKDFLRARRFEQDDYSAYVVSRINRFFHCGRCRHAVSRDVVDDQYQWRLVLKNILGEQPGELHNSLIVKPGARTGFIPYRIIHDKCVSDVLKNIRRYLSQGSWWWCNSFYPPEWGQARDALERLLFINDLSCAEMRYFDQLWSEKKKYTENRIARRVRAAFYKKRGIFLACVQSLGVAECGLASFKKYLMNSRLFVKKQRQYQLLRKLRVDEEVIAQIRQYPWELKKHIL